jgi:uncharacterized protein (TIGR04255 family)
VSAANWELPFGPETPDEIPLPNNPLVEVIAQIRFPENASLARQEFIGPFQERLRAEFPVLRQERETGLLITPDGVATQQASTSIWRMSDADGRWTISVAPGFIALQTADYSRRADFFARLRTALTAFEEEVHPGYFDRLGVRYVNRLVGDKWLKELPRFVRREALGLAELAYSSGLASMSQYVAFAQFAVEGGSMLVRTAYLPPNVTVDPSVAPIADASWLLDLDMSTTPATPGKFDVNALCALGEQHSAHIYRFFRWAVTQELITVAGGHA